MAKNTSQTLCVVVSPRELKAIDRCRQRAEERAGHASRSQIVRELIRVGAEHLEHGLVSEDRGERPFTGPE